MKTSLLGIFSLFVSLVFLPPAFGGTEMVLATGHPGGAYYPLGEKLASFVNCGAPGGFFVTTRDTGGSEENCRLVAEGKADAGFSVETVLRHALTGEGPFANSGPLNLTALAKLHPAAEHLVTTQSSGIRKLTDLEGKRVSIGMSGSGNRLFALELLRIAGLDPEGDLDCVELSQREAAQALATGKIDAAFWNFALPGAAVLELSAFRPLSLIPFTPAAIDNLAARHSWIRPFMIPAGTYPGQDRDILTFCVDEYLIGRADIPAEYARILLHALFDNLQDLSPIALSLKSLSPESAFPSGLPVAPGAVSFFREQGIPSR